MIKIKKLTFYIYEKYIDTDFMKIIVIKVKGTPLLGMNKMTCL